MPNKEWIFDNTKPYVFVSYKREDKKEVEKCILELCNQYGLNIWYDKDLTAGREWANEAKTYLRSVNCKGVLLFASMQALTSRQVKLELDTAKTYEKRIIPINFIRKSFDDILKKDIVKEYNETASDKVDCAEEIITEHLDKKLTYLVLGEDDFYNDLMRSIKKNFQMNQSEESSDDFAEGDNLFDDIDLSDFETDGEDSFGGAEIFDDPFSAKSLDNGNKDILNDNLREKDKKWGILTLHNELEFPMGVIRFQYSTGDEFGFGREIVGLQINTDIIPCRYEGSGTYYEPEYLIFDSLFESLRISCPPNDRVVFYVDPDRFILTEDHAELTLILGTEPAKTKVNDILKEIKGHSKLRIEIDRLNKRAVVSELRANDVIEGSVEIDISSDTSDISGKKQDDGNDSFGFDFGQDDEYELLDFGFNLAELNENTTLSEFEKICENVNFCMELRKVRKDKTVTAQLFDYFMASLLGGCDSPAMKKEDILRKAVYNYCKYAVAKDCDPNTVGFGASQWTWSSNARKAVRPEDRPADYYDANGNFKGSGKLGVNSDIFEKLPRNLTIGDVLKKYENREVGFNTKDNEMIFRSWALIKELNNG